MASTPSGPSSTPRGRAGRAACHIGPNVSFGEQDRKVEVHLIEFEGDLYGRTLEVDFLDLLRPSRKFLGLPDLLAQIRADVEAARVIAG